MPFLTTGSINKLYLIKFAFSNKNDNLVLEEKMSKTIIVENVQEALNFMNESQYPLVFELVCTDPKAYTAERTVENESELKHCIQLANEKKTKVKLTAPACIVERVADALEFIHKFGLPVLIEPAFTLNAQGRAEIRNDEQKPIKLIEKALDLSPVYEVKISTLER